MFDSTKYRIYETDTIIDAMNKASLNGTEFVVVLDNRETVKGVLSNRDLIEALVSGRDINKPIGEICSKSSNIHRSDNVKAIADIFDAMESFALPVVDEKKHLIGVLNKTQIMPFLFEDSTEDIKSILLHLKEDNYEHYIVRKPWGFYKTLFVNNLFLVKIICVLPMEKLSLQSHEHRSEHWIIANGTGVAIIDNKSVSIKKGDCVFIPIKSKHRLVNSNENAKLILIEVQMGDYFSENDIVRYEDVYGRR